MPRRPQHREQAMEPSHALMHLCDCLYGLWGRITRRASGHLSDELGSQARPVIKRGDAACGAQLGVAQRRAHADDGTAGCDTRPHARSRVLENDAFGDGHTELPSAFNVRIWMRFGTLALCADHEAFDDRRRRYCLT